MKTKWWLFAAVAVLAAWGIWTWVRSPAASPPKPQAATTLLPDFLPPPQDWQPGTEADAAPPVFTPDKIGEAMIAWRQAIINRDSEAVVNLDVTFADQPDVFQPALIDCAQTEVEDRVRSFCTRVLGKLKRGDAQLYEGLLKDKSEFVRFNAAWALGQIGAKTATPTLKRTASRDKSEKVRRSAQQSLQLLR